MLEIKGISVFRTGKKGDPSLSATAKEIGYIL